MLHPSYTDLMEIVNSEVEQGEAPVVNSRYSIVLATSRRAKQLIDGAKPKVEPDCPKALSIAIDELYQSEIKILTEEEAEELAKQQQELARANEETIVIEEENDEESEGTDEFFATEEVEKE